MALLFIVFAITGVALPVLPLHVHHDLGMSTFVVGLVSGSQFAAALVSRLWSGRLSDQRGPSVALKAGLAAAVVSGALCLAW